MSRLAIGFLMADGSISPTDFRGEPVISVEMFDAGAFSEGAPLPLSRERMLALVDSGASKTCSSPDVIGRHSSRPSKYVAGVTGTGAHRSYAFDLRFHVPGLNIIYRTDVAAIQRAPGSRVSVILGRDFLMLCNMVMDSRKSEFFIEGIQP